MRQSKFFMPTLKEAPSDAVAKSHQLMLRGGYIRQVTAGVYAYLPLGYRVLRKAENIIEEETDREKKRLLLDDKKIISSILIELKQRITTKQLS